MSFARVLPNCGCTAALMSALVPTELFWSNAYPHRSLPFATRHSFFLQGSNLIVVSKEKKKDYAIGRPKIWRMRAQRSKRGRGGRGGDDEEDDEEEEVTKMDL